MISPKVAGDLGLRHGRYGSPHEPTDEILEPRPKDLCAQIAGQLGVIDNPDLA